ncbi:uncharacterized protein LOC132701041 [Cylas formicarius]|uniref:uncharacterized protein LOC132701041 n=1 Tax=Cylas formicarius TaxID=197179 RepID=UPI0029583B15|nr:uncharacterized protein LOC132701041 [Cylas formicarius]
MRLITGAVGSLLCLLLGISSCTFAQGQEYLLTAPVNEYFTQNQPDFANPSQVIPFQQSSGLHPISNSFSPPQTFYSRDLQTSDLPLTLQQNLPQYRHDPVQNQPSLNFKNRLVNTPVGFRPSSQFVQPSTHRPNYSHLFSQSHFHDPSQTETFLGEVTIDSPLEPQFNEFKSERKIPPEITDNSFANNEDTSAKTRSDSEKKKSSLAKNYFVDRSGAVHITTKTPFSPKPTSTTKRPTTLERKNPFSPTQKSTTQHFTVNLNSGKKPFVARNANENKNTLDLDSLLEDPIEENEEHSNKDNVEVIKKHEIEEPEDDYEYETNLEDAEEDEEEYSEDHQGTNQNNELENGDYPLHEYKENETEIKHYFKSDQHPSMVNSSEIENHNETYEVLTMKPTSSLEQSHFKDFVDVAQLDTTTQQTQMTNVVTQPPLTVSMSSSVNVKRGNEIISSNGNSEVINGHPGLVVSVVTSKTVVNNTIIAPATPSPTYTESMEVSDPSSRSIENSTDSWIVVASVQTSRSVSGARYLPSSVVQDERIRLLNEDDIGSRASNEELDLTTHEMMPDYETTLNETPEPSIKVRTSTESLIDKLDRVQSDLSSGFLTGGFKTDNIAVINAENMPESSRTSTTPTTTKIGTTKDPYPQVKIRKFSSGNRPSSTSKPKRVQNIPKKSSSTLPTPINLDIPQGDQPVLDASKIALKQDISSLLPPGYKPPREEKDANQSILDQILSKVRPKASNENNKTFLSTKLPPVQKVDDISAFLPPGYKPPKEDDAASKTIKQDDISVFTPSGYHSIKTTEKTKAPTSILQKAKPVEDISALLPPGYKLSKYSTTTAKPKVNGILMKAKPVDDITALLPPGYKLPKSASTEKSSILSKATPIEDISALLPPGYKPSNEETKGSRNLLKNAQPVDISAFLPPGYKVKSTKESKNDTKLVTQNIPSNLLPPGFNDGGVNKTQETTSETATSSTGKPKVVFPSRPGGGSRKSSRLTTPRSAVTEMNKPTIPTIHKGWPSRATTEFTGWPTPSTTPISIEKLLEAARTAQSSTSSETPLTTSSTTTTTTTTTTTPKPTTPGVCTDECDLVGTIKLIGGAKWVPELLDRNTKEYQILANEVQTQLNDVYSSSAMLSQWYKKIRIDGFSEGSILVDYLVELNEVGRKVDTQEIKRLFHDSLLNSASKQNSNREGKSLNETVKEGKLILGDFVVDPKYTDFIVLPKHVYPTVGYAEDNVLLPQWAIAVIVIGLASLLFVIIFGVTVLVNRQKNAKKKSPTPLTEDMLNELNKNHMGGFDNFGADDFYNMEDVWNENAYEHKPHKKRSNGSINDNSMSNLYDSWRSEWNGYYYNNYYGNPTSSQHSGFSGRNKRPDYDTNF